MTNYSYGAGMTLMPHVLGTNDVLQGPVTDWDGIARHARLMLCFGGLPLKNGLVTAGGAGSHDYAPQMRRAAEAGVRFVNISPFRGDCAEFLGAEWVPIRPNSDAALVLAMLHALAVLPDWRGRGLGAWMVRRAARFAESHGATELALAVTVANAPARRLYDRLGLAQVGSYAYWRGGEG